MTVRSRGPQRTCLGCRQTLDQSDLVRFVRAPDGEVLIDERRKLPGRGAYTCPTRRCIEQAARKNQFARVFRMECRAASSEALLEKFRQAQLARMVSLVGMARKSGQLLAGSNLVIDALGQGGRVALVLLALDASGNVAEKVMRKTAAQGVPVVMQFDKATQGQITGRAEHSVLALPGSQLTDAFQSVWQRYQDVLGEN